MKKSLLLIMSMQITLLMAMDAPNLDEDLLKFIHSKIRAANKQMCCDETQIDFSKINDVNPENGFTPLMQQLLSFWLPCSGDPRVIEYLISKGARADVKDAQGNTTIFFAIRGGNFDAIPVLQKHNAQMPVWDKSPENVSPLVACVTKLYSRLDLEHNMCHTYEERILALYKSATDVIPDLIKAGNHPDQRHPDMKTPLMLAAKYAFDGIVKHLVDAGADQTLIHKGKTAADYIPQLPPFCYVGDPKKCREYLLKP